jgi:gamma-aminobutyric acid receptor subunit beta
MSPIASLRNRQYTNTLAPPQSGVEPIDSAKFPPSFRISRNYGGTTGCRPGLRYRGQRGQSQKPKMFHAIRKGASVLKASIPKIKDVNVIDKYSRVIFPVSFLAFNIGYWVFYVFE